MQSKTNFRSALSWVLLSSVAACTGTVEGSGMPSAGSAAPSNGDAPAAGANGTSQGAGAAPLLPAWSGAVGSWCGPAEDATLWLVAKPQTSACDASSKKVYGSTEDTAEGLTLALDTAALGTLPTLQTRTARYCNAAGVCSDVQVSLSIESYTQGEGATGTWAFVLPDATELKGTLAASWCSFDELLPAHPEGERLARDIKIIEVSVYQGVKVPIARDMVAIDDRNADLVQQREAMLRVFVEPSASFVARQLTARVTLEDEGHAARRFEETIDIAGISREEDGSSTFNVALPKDAFNESTRYSVELREASRCTPLTGVAIGARFPEAGLTPVGARKTGPVKVLIVPVRYDTDGSGRLPDTSPDQLEQMQRRLYSMYPTTEVTLEVREPVGTELTDLGDMLDQMRQLREADDAPSDLAYYGMVRQADTLRDYCSGSCTTGIAGFGSQNGTASAGMGIGFLDAAAGTFVHELGHIYRRPHAPCGGAAGPDEQYPYAEAGLGSWGYDLQTRELFDPSTHVDFMSYCAPEWISDYNYQLILERIALVNQMAGLRRITLDDVTDTRPLYRTLLVKANGQTRWGLDLRPRFEPPGDRTSVDMLDAQGGLLEQVTAFEELTGDGERAIFVPARRSNWHSVRALGAVTTLLSGVTRNKPFRR